eukprot:scaffold1193_cov158-Amphora_coffeaeformis.AAC.3
MKAAMDDNLNDGWDDFDVDDSGVVEEKSAIVGGWEDEDDLAFLDDDNHDEDALLEKTRGQHSHVASARASSMRVPVENKDSNGWEEDDDLNFDDDDEDDGTNPLPGSPTTTPVAAPQAQRMPSQTYEKLENYVELLPHLSASVNAVLETEYNTLQKANEVLEYFTQRPGLVDYTIEKELPRMDYVVIEESGMPLQEKEQVAAWMVQAGSAGSLLPRCANQSLLADLLQAMTGPDMLIRPQFLATAIATSCNFVLDALQESVMVRSNMELTIPTEEGRWKIADLAVFCQLNASSPPSIFYRLDVVKPVVKDGAWKAHMASAARLIESMELPDESFMNVSYQQSEDGIHYRDVFLQQSQTLLQNSAVGLRSALREIDAVAGISNKLSKLPVFLPEDVMEAADRVHEQPSVHAANPEHRPTSIIGGFLSSGLNRLAQSVNLPEEDPEYYKDWQAQQQRQVPRGHGAAQGQPQLYNRPQAEGPRPPLRGPQLYNLQTGPAPKLYNEQSRYAAPVMDHGPSPSGLQLYNRTEPGPPAPDELTAMESNSPWEAKATLHEQNKILKEAPEKSADLGHGWVYDPETDIIPTRKRWVNPRPGLRALEHFMTGQ